MNIVTPLIPGQPEFTLYLALAYRWIKDRPWAYPDDHVGLVKYLEEMSAPNMQHFIVSHKGTMFALLTCIEGDGHIWTAHITSSKEAKRSQVIDAARYLINLFFSVTKAELLKATSPTYKGKRKHFGSHQLCVDLGFKLNGIKFSDSNNHKWDEYQLSRKEWGLWEKGR